MENITGHNIMHGICGTFANLGLFSHQRIRRLTRAEANFLNKDI